MSKELRIALISGTLAFLGAIAGVSLSSYFDKQKFEREFYANQARSIINKRLNLIENCARARASMFRANMIMEFVDLEKMKIHGMANTKGEERERWKEFDTGVRSIEMQQEFVTLQSNYIACTQMAGLLFGPKTKKAALDLNDVAVWYKDPNTESIRKFMEGMMNELTYFPDELKP